MKSAKDRLRCDGTEALDLPAPQDQLEQDNTINLVFIDPQGRPYPSNSMSPEDVKSAAP
jgi:hypothetical protein